MSTQQSQAQRDRVDAEQKMVKEKAQDALDAARKLRKGEVELEVPATETVAAAIAAGEATLERFQSSDRGQVLGDKGQKIVGDIKKVLSDESQMIQEKNQGDLLQSIVRDIWGLLQELNNDPQLRELFEEWQRDLISIMSSGDIIQFFQQTGELFTSLRDTEEFIELLTQLIDLAKVVLAEKTELVTDQDPVALSDYKHQREVESRRVDAELRTTLRALSYNDVWRSLVSKGRQIEGQAKEATKDTTEKAKQAYYRIRDSQNFQNLVIDFKALIQRLVGKNKSVDPLFDYSKAAVEDIVNNQQLSDIANELHSKLSRLADDPSLLDNKAYQDEFRKLTDKADKAVEEIRNSHNLSNARKEAISIIDAIKAEPSSHQLLKDLKKLWRDIASDKEGEIIDSDMLANIRQLVVPILLEHLHNVPLPPIKDRAEFLGKYDYTIDNMKISLPELIPENIHVRFEFNMDANPLNLEATNQHTYLYLQASNIQLHIHDAHFAYSRLTVPKHEDSGVFDVDTSGKGLTIWMKMEVKTGTKEGKNFQYVDVLKSDVRISKFSIDFKGSKHDKLYEFLSHMFQNRIKNGVIELIQEKLKTFGTFFSEQLMTLIEQAKVKSQLVSQAAKYKTEQARDKLEILSLQAKEKLRDAKDAAAEKVEQAKDSAKSSQASRETKETAKGVVGLANEKAQEFLDDQKAKLEQQPFNKPADSSRNYQSF